MTKQFTPLNNIITTRYKLQKTFKLYKTIIIHSHMAKKLYFIIENKIVLIFITFIKNFTFFFFLWSAIYYNTSLVISNNFQVKDNK